MTDWTDRACYVPLYLDYMELPDDNIALRQWDQSATDFGLRFLVNAFEPFRPLFMTNWNFQAKYTDACKRLTPLSYSLPFPGVYEITREQANTAALQEAMGIAWALLEALQAGLDHAHVCENAMEWIVLYAKVNSLAEDAMDNWITAMKWVLGKSPSRIGIDEDIFGHP